MRGKEPTLEEDVSGGARVRRVVVEGGREWSRGSREEDVDLGSVSQSICPDISAALARGRLSLQGAVLPSGGSGHGNLLNIVCHVHAPAVRPVSGLLNVLPRRIS